MTRLNRENLEQHKEIAKGKFRPLIAAGNMQTEHSHAQSYLTFHLTLE